VGEEIVSNLLRRVAGVAERVHIDQAVHAVWAPAGELGKHDAGEAVPDQPELRQRGGDLVQVAHHRRYRVLGRFRRSSVTAHVECQRAPGAPEVIDLRAPDFEVRAETMMQHDRYAALAAVVDV
jgi:hypothetical protein